jgi:dihydrolipoamide dehydrogenase
MASYDVVVIGSGPGGYSAAIRAGQFGLKTALIEKAPKLGGTCLHVGCIPTKSLLHSAGMWELVLHADAEGISLSNPMLNFAKVMDRKDGIITKHAKGIEFLMKKNKVEVIAGYGRLLGGGKVEVTGNSGTSIVEAKSIIIATGSEARMLPNLQTDPQRIVTNVEILKLPEIPKRLGIIGSGAVGSEFASIFRRFGSEVTIYEMLPRLVPVEDEDVSKELERCFRKIGIRCETGARVENIVNAGNSVRFNVTLASGQQEATEVDTLLIAVGRKPNTDRLGVENTRVQLERGFIRTDRFQQTDEPGVYAIGDVVLGTPQLAHVATAEGMVAVAHIAGVDVQPINRNRIPGATYTDPGIGSVGLTEAQARAAGHKVKIGKFPFAANSKSTILGHHEGFVKIVADEHFGEILGVHIIGYHGYELIAEAVVAMEAEATVDTLVNTIHAHPTQYEALGEAFNAVYGMAINA